MLLSTEQEFFVNNCHFNISWINSCSALLSSKIVKIVSGFVDSSGTNFMLTCVQQEKIINRGPDKADEVDDVLNLNDG